MSLVGVIDLGTHNCRMSIARIGEDDFERVRVYSKIVKLGEGVSQNGSISSRATTRTLNALKRMSDIFHEEGIEDIYPLATEGARMAKNANFFFSQVKKETGLDFKIVSPKEEAKLSVQASASLIKGSDRAVFFDIGGGSTEVILASRKGNLITIEDWISLPLGVVRGRDRFGGTMKEAAFFGFVKEVSQAFTPFFRKNIAFFKEPFCLIGSSGTVTTLAACSLELPRYQPDVVDGASFPVSELIKYSRVSNMAPLWARKINPLIGTGRAEFLPSGCAILEGLLGHLPTSTLIAADRGLREGIFYGLIPGAPKVTFKEDKKRARK